MMIILSIIKQEATSVRNLFGWLLTVMSFTLEEFKAGLSIIVLILTLIWWVIKIYNAIKFKK